MMILDASSIEVVCQGYIRKWCPDIGLETSPCVLTQLLMQLSKVSCGYMSGKAGLICSRGVTERSGCTRKMNDHAVPCFATSANSKASVAATDPPFACGHSEKHTPSP